MLNFLQSFASIKKTSWFFILPIFSAVVLSFLFSPGYIAGANDQQLYLPGLLEKISGPLSSGDLFSTFNQSELSLFNEILFQLIEITGLDVFILLFLVAIASRFIYFFAIWRLAGFFTKSLVLRCLSLLLACIPLQAYGAGSNIIENIVVARTVALPLCLLLFVFYLENKKISAALLLALAFAIHPITCLPFLLFFFAIFIRTALRKKLSAEKFFFFLPVAIIIALMLFSLPPKNGSGFLQIMDAPWHEIVVAATGRYLFVLAWQKQLLCLAAEFLVLVLILRTNLADFGSAARKKITYLFFFAPIVLFVLAITTADILKISFAIQLQMARALILWKLLFILIWPAWLYQLQEKKRGLFLTLFSCGFLTSFLAQYASAEILFAILLLIASFKNAGHRHFWPSGKILFFMAAALTVLVPLAGALLRGNLQKANWLIPLLLVAASILAWLGKKYPAAAKYLPAAIIIPFFFYSQGSFSFQNNFQGLRPTYEKSAQAISLCAWTEKNTSPQDLFITENYSDLSNILRLSCRRGVYYSAYEGAQGVFSRNYALEWQKRKKIIEKASTEPKAAEKILEGTGANYLISQTILPWGKPIFISPSYYIYSLK